MDNIYLVGFMGSGKSTLGKKLSEIKNYEFIDTDKEIEKINSMTINQIFKNFDESFFRQEELSLLKTILKQKKTIISTGGGFVCFNNIMKTIKKNGISIYLKYSSKNLYKRLKENYQERPLINKIQENKREEFISELLQKREKFYLESNFVIDCLSLNEDDILRKINSLISTT